MVALLLSCLSLVLRPQADTSAPHSIPPTLPKAGQGIPRVVQPLPDPPPAQPDRDTGVEVRLEFLHQRSGSSATDLSLGISIINHLDRDIYIPCFELFGSYGGIHYYQKDSGKWKEWDLYTQQPWRLWTCVVYDNGMIEEEMPLLHFNHNDLSRYFEGHSRSMHQQQDSILRAFCAATHQQFKLWNEPGVPPLFLAANQELRFYRVADLEFFLGKKEDYRISFNSAARDSPDRYSRMITVLGPWPDHIFSYRLYTPATVASNTLYLSTMDPSPSPTR